MRTREGQISLMQVIVGVLIVTVTTLVLFQIDTRTTAENVEISAQAFSSINLKVRLNSLYETTLVIPDHQNRKLGEILVYACAYGDETDSFRFQTVDGVTIRAEEEVKRMLDKSLQDNYYFYMPCDPDNPDERRIEAGLRAPDYVENVLATNIDMPLITGGKTKAYLQLWN